MLTVVEDVRLSYRQRVDGSWSHSLKAPLEVLISISMICHSQCYGIRRSLERCFPKWLLATIKNNDEDDVVMMMLMLTRAEVLRQDLSKPLRPPARLPRPRPSLAHSPPPRHATLPAAANGRHKLQQSDPAGATTVFVIAVSPPPPPPPPPLLALASSR